MDLLKAFLFGFTIAISVGPIALLILNNGIVHGYKAALKSALGAGLADFTFAIIAFSFGSIILIFLDDYNQQFKLISAITLVGFGLYMCYEAKKLHKPNSKINKKLKIKGFKTTYMLTIVNPLTIIIFTAFIGQISTTPSILSSLILAFSVFLGSLSIQIIIALSGASFGHFLQDEKHIVWLQLLSGLGIIGFGLSYFV